jgi:hypothetical protein
MVVSKNPCRRRGLFPPPHLDNKEEIVCLWQPAAEPLEERGPSGDNMTEE